MNLSAGFAAKKKVRFFASLRMTGAVWDFFRSLLEAEAFKLSLALQNQ
jgi:hypothetical protein